jgi:two-component system chemotaxis response regulator CheB
MDQQELKDLRILVVEQSDVIKDALTKAFAESEGCQLVGMAAGSDEGLSLVISERPDIVLMDVSPMHPRFELLRTIRRVDQRTIVIVFTAEHSAEMRMACREAGAAFYAAKGQLGDVLELLQLARKLT